ncbi:MAG: VOC family protein [Myxococcota bacterium]
MNLAYVIAYVPDPPGSAAFWGSAFGLSVKFAHESGTYVELDTGSTTLAFVSTAQIEAQGIPFQPARPDEDPLGIEVALSTTDVDAAYTRAIDAGARPVHPPLTKPWGQIVAYVRDRDGILVELCTPMG